MRERNSGGSTDEDEEEEEEVKVKETRIVCYAYDACKWFQQVLSKCLGLGLDSPFSSTCSHHKINKEDDNNNNSTTVASSSSGSGSGGEHADPPPSTDPPVLEALERSRMPPRPPVSSGRGGKTN